MGCRLPQIYLYWNKCCTIVNDQDNYHSVDVCLRTSENQSDFSVPKHNHFCIFMPTFWLHTKVFYWQLVLKLITIKLLLLLWSIFQPPQIRESENSPYIYNALPGHADTVKMHSVQASTILLLVHYALKLYPSQDHATVCILNW